MAFRRKFALCIGIDGYREGSGYSPLTYAAADAIGVAAALLEHCDFDQVLLATDAKDNARLEAIEQQYAGKLRVLRSNERDALRSEAETFFFQSDNPDDVVLFYFAGHGVVENSPVLVAGDFHRDDAPQKVFPVSQVMEWITAKNVEAQNKLVIVDACRSTVGTPPLTTVAPGFQQALTELGHRLAVMFACDVGESSLEDGSLAHGRFSWALTQALEGTAFKIGEEHLLVTHLHEYVANEFRERAESGDWRDEQHPVMFTELDYPFALAYRDVPPPEPLDEYQREILAELHQRGQRQLALAQLERADSTLRTCLQIIGADHDDDARVLQEKGELLALRALALYRLGRSGAWERLADEARALVPENGSLAELEGYRLMERQDFAAAEESLRRAINRAATADVISPLVWTKLGACQFRLQRYAEAQASCARAMQRCVALSALAAAAQNLDLALRFGAWAGDYSAVGAAIQETLDQSAAADLPETLELADLLDAMSAALGKVGRASEGLAPAERAAAIRSRLLGEAHPETVAGFERVADAYRDAGRLHALLVGCTEHPNLGQRRWLKGPTNDVKLAAQLLALRFGFADDQIVQLVHENEESLRPTRGNIEREFGELIAEAQDGDVAFILLAGHMAQMPDRNPKDPEHQDDEVDGLDEVFLPEDVGAWTPGEVISNVIIDDDLHSWLDALRAKGVHVFFVSATGNPDDKDPTLSGEVFVGSADVIQNSAEGAIESDDGTGASVLPGGARVIENSAEESFRIDLGAGETAAADEPVVEELLGSFTTLYAVPLGEREIEQALPSLGQSTYVIRSRMITALCHILGASERPLTYRELVDELRRYYVECHWSNSPYAASSQIDDVVLSRPVWRRRASMTLTRGADGALSMSGGSLRGVTAGSKFAVYPAGSEPGAELPVGYVEAVTVTGASSTVVPCDYDGQPAISADALPTPGRCELVYGVVGDLRLTVAVSPVDPAKRHAESEAAVLAEAERVAAQRGTLLRMVAGDEIPDLQILVGEGDFVLRWQDWSANAAIASNRPENIMPLGFAPVRLEGDWPNVLRRALGNSARVIALQRLADRNETMPFGAAIDGAIQLRVSARKKARIDPYLRVPGDPDYEDGPVNSVIDGDEVRVEVHNVGSRPVDVTILYIDSAMQVVSFFPTATQVMREAYDNRLEPGGDPAIVDFRINDVTVGWEDVLVLATPSVEGEFPLEFTFLERANLDEARAATKSGRVSGIDSPLGELLRHGVYGDDAREGYSSDEAVGFSIHRVSWLVE